MEFQLMIQKHLKDSSTLNALLDRLNRQSQQCEKRLIQEARSKSFDQQQFQFKKKQCVKKKTHFDEYLEAYKRQLVEKGVQMCYSQLPELRFYQQKQELDGSQKLIKNDISQMYSRVSSEHRKCVQFYMKSRSIFEQNVADKLKSLVEGLSFEQL